jgi:hypothetical protein
VSGSVARDERAAVGNQAVDEVNFGTEGAAFKNDRRWCVTRHRDHASDAGMRCIRGGGTAGVSRRGKRDRVDAECFRHAHRRGEPARLE